MVFRYENGVCAQVVVMLTGFRAHARGQPGNVTSMTGDPNPKRSHAHDAQEGLHDHGHDQGHSHGLVDRSIVRSREGVRAVSISLAVLLVTAPDPGRGLPGLGKRRTPCRPDPQLR